MAAKTKLVDGARINLQTGQVAQAGTAQQAAANASYNPTAINASALAPAPTINLKQPEPSTLAAGELGYFESLVTDTQAKAQQADQQQNDALQTYLKAALSSDTETGMQDALYQKNVDPLKAELDDINSQIMAEQHALRRRVEAIRRNKEGMFGSAVEDMVGDAERESLGKQADLAIIQMSRQGKYDSAKDIADRAAKAMFEKQEKRNEALRFNYEQHKSLFDTSEQRAFELAQTDRENKLAEERDMRMARFEQTIKQNDPLYRAQLAKAQADAREASSMSQGASGKYASVITGAANLVGAERGKTSRSAMNQAIASGDYTSAYAQVANNVEESLTGDNKSKFSNARTDYSILSNMRTTIQEFQEAGGDTGFLKGTADQIARRFGQLKTDPKFAALAVQLEREFQSYRQNMTGAAFSPAESREYASVNPRTTASIDLNLATIDGAMNQLENRIVSTINTRVPGANQLYSQINGTVDDSILSDDDAYQLYLQKLNGTK